MMDPRLTALLIGLAVGMLMMFFLQPTVKGWFEPAAADAATRKRQLRNRRQFMMRSRRNRH